MAEVTLIIREFEDAEREDCEVVFEGFPKLVDDGIGAYEFWGSKGHHSDWSVQCEDVTWNMIQYTDEENAIIEKYIDKAADQLCAEYEPPEPDYDERD
jgi:hypothetical protein